MFSLHPYSSCADVVQHFVLSCSQVNKPQFSCIPARADAEVSMFSLHPYSTCADVVHHFVLSFSQMNRPQFSCIPARANTEY